MDWFEHLTGFAEQSPEQVRANLSFYSGRICSTVNKRCWNAGRLTLPSLEQLRTIKPHTNGKLKVCELVADVQHLHTQAENADALFQVASQFNLLEMVSPNVSPEQGIGIYQQDRTQGPACAIAAGAATIYRNYLVELDGQQGQSVTRQINCIADLGEALGNQNNRLWQMKNGYVIASRQGLAEIADHLKDASLEEKQQLKGQLRIGLHLNTEVTLKNCQHRVSQALCSALPIAYSQHPSALWTDFAKLILEAAYEATLAAAVYNANSYGSNKVFLTLLGGGAFGNPEEWILSAIRKALLAYKDADLDVAIVSYYQSNPQVKALADEVMAVIYPPEPVKVVVPAAQPESLSAEQRRALLHDIIEKEAFIKALEQEYSSELYMCPICEQRLDSKYGIFAADPERNVRDSLSFFQQYKKSDDPRVALPVCRVCVDKLALVNNSHGDESTLRFTYQGKEVFYRGRFGGYLYLGFV